MPGEKHPIIAHGELYVEPIVKKSRPIDKSIPHECSVSTHLCRGRRSAGRIPPR